MSGSIHLSSEEIVWELTNVIAEGTLGIMVHNPLNWQVRKLRLKMLLFKVTKAVRGRVGTWRLLCSSFHDSRQAVFVGCSHDLKAPSYKTEIWKFHPRSLIPPAHTAFYPHLNYICMDSIFCLSPTSPYFPCFQVKTPVDFLSPQSQWNHPIPRVWIFLGGKKWNVTI